MFGLISFVSHAAPQKPNSVYTVASFYKKEVINGVTFVYEEEVLNGRYKATRFIEDRAVSPELFDEKIVEAEKEQRRQQRRDEFEKRMSRLQAQHVSEIDILKKLIRISMTNIQEWLKKIKSHQLEAFLIFNEQTFASQEQFETLPVEIIASGQRVIDLPFRDIQIEELKILLQKLDDMGERLRTLVYGSIDYAIKQCDDPRVLKELLTTVENL